MASAFDFAFLHFYLFLTSTLFVSVHFVFCFSLCCLAKSCVVFLKSLFIYLKWVLTLDPSFSASLSSATVPSLDKTDFLKLQNGR